jgi:cysteine sulfinate desulfinase/cysteine desulfurase-like protein|tara:strand:+ start:1675 stop:1887 length:213 start_codon:yes stop_codon:yes gene_type:complete
MVASLKTQYYFWSDYSALSLFYGCKLLKNIKIDTTIAESLRIGIGRFNTTDEVELVISLIAASVEKLRNI